MKKNSSFILVMVAMVFLFCGVVDVNASVPDPPKETATVAKAPKPSKNPYLDDTIREGESWAYISQWYGIPIESFKKWNPEITFSAPAVVGQKYRYLPKEDPTRAISKGVTSAMKPLEKQIKDQTDATKKIDEKLFGDEGELKKLEKNLTAEKGPMNELLESNFIFYLFNKKDGAVKKIGDKIEEKNSKIEKAVITIKWLAIATILMVIIVGCGIVAYLHFGTDKKIEAVPAAIELQKPVLLTDVRGHDVTYRAPLINGRCRVLQIAKNLKGEYKNPSTIPRASVEKPTQVRGSIVGTMELFFDGAFDGNDPKSILQKAVIALAKKNGELEYT